MYNWEQGIKANSRTRMEMNRLTQEKERNMWRPILKEGLDRALDSGATVANISRIIGCNSANSLHNFRRTGELGPELCKALERYLVEHHHVDPVDVCAEPKYPLPIRFFEATETKDPPVPEKVLSLAAGDARKK